MLILGNMGVIVALLVGKVLQLIFFGPLYTLEQERVYESAWYAVTESVLLVPLFRDDSKIEFGIFFATLLFLRVFHWISSDRIELIFQTPASYFSHFRLSSAIVLLGLADLYLIRYWVMTFHYSSNSDRNSVMVPTFTFECLLLLNSILTTAGKYILNIIEAVYLEAHEDEDIWEPKTHWSFVLEAVSLLTRLVAYCALFFFILLPYRLLPLHIIRDTYTTAKSLYTAIQKHLNAKNAKRQIETVVRTVTAEELTSADDVCIICREEMTLEQDQHPRTVPKKLLCGHIIHFGCLKSWLERSLRCPTCRRSVMDGTFPNQPGAAANNNNANAQPPVDQRPNVVPAAANGAPAPNAGAAGPGDAQIVQNQHEIFHNIILNHHNHIHQQNLPNAVPGAQPNQQLPTAVGAGAPTQPAATTRPHSEYVVSSGPANHVFVSTQVFNFPNQSEIPESFQMPFGWNVLKAQETPEGELQIQLTNDYWATVMPAPQKIDDTAHQSESQAVEPTAADANIPTATDQSTIKGKGKPALSSMLIDDDSEAQSVSMDTSPPVPPTTSSTSSTENQSSHTF